jgi:hypothetical protein
MSIDIIDDFIPKDYQEYLLATTIHNRYFPWHFLYEMSGAERPAKIDGINMAAHQHGFQHTIVDHTGNTNSPFEDAFTPLAARIIDHYQTNIHLVRIKIGMVCPMEGGGVAYPHTDYTSEHKTLVYYINDVDGDTIFYNEWKDGTERDTFSVQQRVHPKMGRAVVFDGLQYHSTEYPTKDVRGFININYKIAT